MRPLGNLWHLVKILDAHKLVTVPALLTSLSDLLNGCVKANVAVTDEARQSMIELLSGYEAVIREIGRGAAWVALNMALTTLRGGGSIAELLARFAEIPGRIHDELVIKTVFTLTAEEADLFDGKHQFSPWQIEARYGHALDDMEEAAKCFALERYTGHGIPLGARDRTLAYSILPVCSRHRSQAVMEHHPKWSAAC